jgi:hypothetical protein
VVSPWSCGFTGGHGVLGAAGLDGQAGVLDGEVGR